MVRIITYPSPSTQARPLNDSFGRIFVPGTTRKYVRAAEGCLPGGAGHGGIDIPGAVGAKALACISGKISFKSFGSSFGNQLTIIAPDANGNFTDASEGFFYAHLNAIHVANGAHVSSGDHIADIGATGQVTGPHIHFEHRLRWQEWCTAVNPFTQLERARVPSTVRVSVNGVDLNNSVSCFLNQDDRVVIEVRKFLQNLRYQGAQILFDFDSSRSAIKFTQPDRTQAVNVQVENGSGLSIVRDLISVLDPPASVTFNPAGPRIAITGLNLKIPV